MWEHMILYHDIPVELTKLYWYIYLANEKVNSGFIMFFCSLHWNINYIFNKLRISLLFWCLWLYKLIWTQK